MASVLAIAALQWSASADRTVLQSLAAEPTGSAERIVNPGFEEGTGAPLADWTFWQQGYEIEPQGGREGTRGIVCKSDNTRLQFGASHVVTLNQTQPRAIVVTGWSKARRVEGGTDNGYSIYLDIMFTDGTPLWGQTACFSVGTHDWQQRRCLVVPAKPIQKVSVHALFRGHRGTAWFDDFSLAELAEDASLFEGGPVQAPAMEKPLVSKSGHHRAFSSRSIRPRASYRALL